MTTERPWTDLPKGASKIETRGRKPLPIWHNGELRKDGIPGLAKQYDIDYNTCYRRLKRGIPLDNGLWERRE